MPLLSKEFIIQTYRKEVSAYGKVLGERPFRRQTGISSTYFYGGYWQSWSAFQTEAGYVPNRRCTRTPNEVLLRELADLALRLDRLPTRKDMIRRKKEDPSFPDPDAFSRLGPHAARLLRLEDFCKGKPQLAPVAAMLERRRIEFIDRNRYDSLRLHGFVYLARRGEPEAMTFEIGCERAAGKHLEHLARRMSCLPGTIHMIDTDDPEGLRRYWRTRFHSRRLGRKKYFRLFPEDVLAFRWRRFQ